MDIKTNPLFIISVLFTCLSLAFNVCHGVASITANQSLSGDKTIVSSGGVFELGFFKPGNSSKYYVGIWNKKVAQFQQIVVWVANRDKAVSDKYSSELRIVDGNLVLFNESKSRIWSTDLKSATSNSVEAILLDEGNFVLRDGTGSSEPLWQSFDHPTDTWLPGSKLGFNKITNRTLRLTSWKHKEDPAPGLFSLELDLTGNNGFVLLWNMSEQFWNSGPWDGQMFTRLPEMRLNFMYNFQYINNENESCFTYSQYNNSIMSQFVMGVGGQLRQQAWLEPAKQLSLFWYQPTVQCKVYAYCGTFGSCNVKSQPLCNCLTGFVPKLVDDWNSGVYSGGCVRRTGLHCGNSSVADGKSDRFLSTYNMVVPKYPQKVAARSARECESTCLSNCSCTAYAYDSNQCQIWSGDLLNLQQLAVDDPSGRTLYIRVAASEVKSLHNKKRMLIGLAGGSVGTVVLLGLVIMVFRIRKRRIEMATVTDPSLMAFGYRDLQIATKNFSEKLGGGGFGSVFKGILPDSSVVAVKKLESISQGEKQFRSEVSIIGTIQHVNLVRLRGFCSSGTRKLLVYDYMPNGSLDSHLFHGNDSKVLDWKMRYQIALGMARGLAYLHEKCRECIIHCDIKPDNILLDADFYPKIADFGLAKLFGREFSRVLTTVRGTVGYLAPEWISGVAVTAKADVYSYGMMLFELVSGSRNSEQPKEGKVKYFPMHVASLISNDGNVLQLLDPRLEGNADVEELTRICKVACWCIQYNEAQRPSMGLVVNILDGVLDMNIPPIPRFLEILGCNEEHTNSSE